MQAVLILTITLFLIRYHNCFAVCCKRLLVIEDKEDGKVTLALLPGSSNQVPYKYKSSPFFFLLPQIEYHGRGGRML